MRYKLHIFPFSNFCEKTLWALDRLGVPYDTQMHFPGPHASAIRKLSGQTAVPVLEDGPKVVAGSAAIIAHVMSKTDPSAILPKAHAAEILAWQDRFDAIGGTLRAALFYDLLPHPRDAITTLTMGRKSAFSVYGVFFRAMIPMLRRMLKEKVPSPDSARQDCAAMMDEVATVTSETGYLVGDRFTLADIAAAATFFPVCLPDNAMGEPKPEGFPKLDHWLERWQGHAALPYIRTTYENHRLFDAPQTSAGAA